VRVCLISIGGLRRVTAWAFILLRSEKRLQWVMVALWCACAPFANAQSVEGAPKTFHLVRSEEDYGPHRADKFAPAPEPYKYVRLSADGETYLSIGGELRERFESINAPRFGVGARADSFTLQRVLLHGDLHVGNEFRAYVEVGKHDAFNKRAPLAPVDRDGADVQNAFVDFTPASLSGLRLRLGRQELLFNFTQRFLSVREGPNVRQSFDGARLSWSGAHWKLDAFGLRPVELRPGAFDDRGDPKSSLTGVYASRALLGGAGAFDIYALAYDRWSARYGQTVGDERRRMLGVRYVLRRNGWDVDAEALYQGGTFASADIQAWAFGVDAGHTFEAALKPRVGIRIDGASGGSPNDAARIRTFNPMFPKARYFDETPLTVYANLLSLRPGLFIRPAAALTLEVSGGWRWRQNTEDAVYIMPFVPIGATQNNAARYVGRWSVFDAMWRVNRWWTLQAEYVHVDIGDAVRLAGGRDVDYLEGVVQLRF